MATRGEYAKGRARREQILGEAVRLFAGAGYRGASLRDLAVRCDLSLAGLLHHVGDKESLLLAVLERRDEDDAAESDLVSGSGRDRLRALTEVVRRNQSRRGIVELYSVLSTEATSADHPAPGAGLGRAPARGGHGRVAGPVVAPARGRRHGR